MDLLVLFRKEAITVRRRWGLFLILLVLIPGVMVVGTVVFEQSIPRDIPVGLVGADESTTPDDIAIVRAGVAFFSTPVTYDTSAEARDALQREQVYFVIEVPANMTVDGAAANFTMVSDQTIVPFQEPANFTVAVMEFRLDRALPSDVAVEHQRLGARRVLPEYLVPTGLLAFVVVYALVYFPYHVQQERLVLDRLRTETRLDVVVASKLVFYGALLAGPTIVVGAVSSLLGYDVAATVPFTLGVLAVTFLYLAAGGLAVLFLLEFENAAIIVNLGLAFGVFALSSFVYPVGFFSPTRKAIARALPTHYSVILSRSAMLRDAPASLYADYLLWLVVAAAASLAALKGAIVLYEWRQ